MYFHWLETVPGKGSVDFAGYIRLQGELSILGIISASLTFNLQLAYHKEGGSSIVWGEATLIVEIEVLFFSADVSVHCRREFAGSKDSDPNFIEPFQTRSLGMNIAMHLPTRCRHKWHNSHSYGLCCQMAIRQMESPCVYLCCSHRGLTP